MVHDLFYRSHPFERQLSLHFRIVGEVFFKLIIRISDSQRPSPASEWQLTIWLILFYHVSRAVSTFFLRVCQWTMPRLFVPSVAHFSAEVEGGVAHDPQLRQFVCHEFFIFFSTRCSRQRPAGTQIPLLPLCVPKLSAARQRDSACLAHKSRIYRFVCQSSRCPAERQRRAGTQTSNKPICVPPLTFARMRDSADKKRR